jgi:FtsP/CotA-like multicopper oxidase with cupredoxin domain
VRDVRGTDGSVADAFVYLAKGLEDRVFAAPAEPVVIDQRGCWYVPRVAGAMTGQPVVFRSSDDTLHNVHGEPRTNARWNLGLPRPNSARTLVLENPEVMVPVRCDVHPWMRLDLGILPHPYFAVTGEDGRFRFANVPAGTYTLAAWHPMLPRREQPITVTAGGTTMVAVAFAATGAGHAP